jgi:hypothetical protein
MSTALPNHCTVYAIWQLIQGSWSTSLVHLAHNACDSNILKVSMQMTLAVTGVVKDFIKKIDM